MALILPKLIHKDQAGSILARQAGDNTRRRVDLIYVINKTQTPVLLLSLDTQKALDGLHHIGMRGLFFKAVEAIHSIPTAKVKLSYSMSETFPKFNTTRQGCPLSPLLFMLCLDPLAAAIRLHSYIKGVKIRQQEFKLSLFADDILLTLTEPHKSLPVLLNVLNMFIDLSGYKINTSKMEALPPNISLCLNCLCCRAITLTIGVLTPSNT